MSLDTGQKSIIEHNKNCCLFCNAQLSVSTRNCLNIFKTILLPVEKKACDIIESILDIEVTEETVHSNVICKKCFKLINEFADLETLITKIKEELNTCYNRTVEYVAANNTLNNKPSFAIVQKLSKQNGTEGSKLSQIFLGKGNNILSKNSQAQVLVIDENTDLSTLNVEEYEIGEVLEDYEVTNTEEDEIVQVQIKTEMENDGYEDHQSQESLDPSPIHIEVHDNKVHCLLCTDDETRFSCEPKDTSYMTLHLKVDHEVKSYICDICFQEFKKRNDLSSHLDDHTAQEEGDFQCEICNRIFSNLRLFRIHKRLHTNQTKQWACVLCNKKYSSRNLLEEHNNTHTGSRPYLCPHCGKDFASKYTFKSHLKTHETRVRNYNCSSCDKTFLSAQNLMQHEKTHTDVKDYVCDTCGKGFSSLRNLEVHSIVHSGIKPFVCNTCGKAFARKAEIKDHERTHTGERPFQCELCGSQFSQRSNLQSHKRVTHFDDRRYRCDTCGKGFKRRRLLDYHIKAVHTGERPYKCPTCDATFVYPEHFKKHVRIHTGIKPYKCEVCGKAFNSRDNRNAHRFVHSDKKPYECLVCGMGFMRKPLLYNHMTQAGHQNDRIVVNQPTCISSDGESQEIEMTIVDADSLQMSDTEGKPKLYFTELGEHVIIQDGDEKTLLMADGTKIKTLNDSSDQLVDEDGNLVGLEGNFIEIDEDQLIDNGEITMTATINEHGQLVNEDGQIINEHGEIIDVSESLVVNEHVNFGEDGIIVEGKEDGYESDSKVQYVEIHEEGEGEKPWLHIADNDDDSN